MAYIQGNLALQTKKKQEQGAAYQEKKRTVVRKKGIPVQEKLLYMFTVAVCVLVAGVIIFRYAQIYQMNMQIKDLTVKYNQLAADIQELQIKKETLSDPGRIYNEATGRGMAQANGDDTIKVPLSDDSNPTAMKP